MDAARKQAGRRISGLRIGLNDVLPRLHELRALVPPDMAWKVDEAIADLHAALNRDDRAELRGRAGEQKPAPSALASQDEAA